MNQPPSSNEHHFLWLVSTFLAGAVSGIAGFALWAEHSGLLLIGPLFTILFPICLGAGILVAYLPLLIGQLLVAIGRMKRSRTTK